MKTKGINPIKNGIRLVNKNWKMVIFLLLINILLALALAYPMKKELSDYFSYSLVSEKMKKSFDYTWWGEFSSENGLFQRLFDPSLSGLGAILTNIENYSIGNPLSKEPILNFFLLFYMLISTFFAGGILGVLNSEEKKFFLRLFFEKSGEYFTRFFILAIISSFLYFFIVNTVGKPLKAQYNRISGSTIHEWNLIIFVWISSLFIIFVFLLFHMIFHYIRIKIVVDSETNILKAIRDGILFVFKNFWGSLRIFYTLILIYLLSIAVFTILYNLTLNITGWLLIIPFLIQQLFMFATIWIRCSMFSCQLEFYKNRISRELYPEQQG